MIILDFFLVSYNPARVFIENEKYTHESGTVGTFSISFSSENIDFWNADFDPVVGENGQTLLEQPYLESGAIIPEEEIPYGDPTEYSHYDFTIIDNQDHFDLFSAIGNKTAYLATAQVIVSNINATNTYGMTLAFTNQTNTDPFKMSLVGGSGSHYIEYKLFFNNTMVVPGIPIDWNEPVVNGTFIKAIEVTQIQESAVENLLEGTYSDTITVNLTPKDSM